MTKFGRRSAEAEHSPAPSAAAKPKPAGPKPAPAPAAHSKKPAANTSPPRVNAVAKAQPIEIGGRTDEYFQTKTTIFNALIDTIDLSQLAQLDTESAAEEIRDIVNEIISIKNVQMSIAEQEALLQDICNDVLGYGPLEPLLARATLPRDTSTQARAASRLTLLASTASGFVLLGVMWLVLARFVVRPLERVTAHAVRVGETDDLGARLGLAPTVTPQARRVAAHEGAERRVHLPQSAGSLLHRRGG